MAARTERTLILDTTCIVALVSSSHEHHGDTVRGVDRELRTHATLAVPVHALLEAYSVLTRLPPPHRIAPAAAAGVLRANFADAARVVGTSAGATWKFLDAVATAGVAGGRTYDAWIAEAARGSAPATLLTWNFEHFKAFADEGLAVRAPR